MRASLLHDGVELEERDFFQQKFTEPELRELLGEIKPSELFAWKSPSFRALGRPREDFSEEELLQFMLGEPRLIRRQLIRVEGHLVVGASKAALAELFP